MGKRLASPVILGVGAHPDDLDFVASGTVAQWIRGGATCYYLICTDGSKGSDDPRMTEERLRKIRRAEQITAGKILGLKDVFFLNFKDSELLPDPALKKDIVRHIRMLKPDIVITVDPTVVYSPTRGFINHTDHRACGFATIDAVFPLARDRLTFRELEEEGLTPHKVVTLYLTRFEDPTDVVDISEAMYIKMKALQAHASQVGEEQIKRIKKFCADLGKKHGYRFAEGFVKITLPT